MQHRLSTEPVGILDDLSDVILAVWVSFAEIYNECIYDLLTPSQQSKNSTKTKLQLGSFKENTYIKNLTNVNISSGIEAYQILQYGLHNLNYAATTINSHSSRSHSIFTIKIAQMSKGTNEYRLNYFNFCDLAGSEKLKKTLNIGDRLKESNSINTSLLVLGRCISCIRESQKKNINKLVPFRESKLTRLFQRPLTGFESLSMVVNMNPSVDMFDESQHVLNFSALARDIIVKQMPIKLQKKNRFSNYLQSRSTAYSDIKETRAESEISELQDIIDKLHNDLEQQSRNFMEYEQKIREDMIAEYRVIIQGIEEYHRQHISRIEAYHCKQIETIKANYENDKSVEVIDLDSSTEEDKSFQQIPNAESQKQINELKLEIAELKSELVKNNVIISEKDRKILELQKTLADAEETYKDIEGQYLKKLDELMAEILELNEANSELNMQNEEYSKLASKELEDICD